MYGQTQIAIVLFGKLPQNITISRRKISVNNIGSVNSLNSLATTTGRADNHRGLLIINTRFTHCWRTVINIDMLI